jgi:hypothetical protein
MQVSRIIIGAVLVSGLMASAHATTYYIRPDGGGRYDTNRAISPGGSQGLFTGSAIGCNGQADVSYAAAVAAGGGATTNLPCAFNQFTFMYDDQTINNWQSNGASWIAAPSDTVIVRGCASDTNNTAPACRVGWEANTGIGAGLLNCFGVGVCGIPPPPAGLHLWGQNHGACSTTVTPLNGSGAVLQPNPAMTSEIYGGFGMNTTFDISAVSSIDVQCINFNVHGSCIKHGTPNPLPCSTSNPVSDYSDEGIRWSSTTGTVNLTDVIIGGNGDSCTIGPNNGIKNFNDVLFRWCGFTGGNEDNGTDSQTGGVANLNNLTIEFIGCNHLWPEVTTIPISHCYDDSNGGFGDGWATPSSSHNTYNVTHLTTIYNTQDGFDVGHNQGPGAFFSFSMAYGSEGGTFKSGGEPYTLTNSISITNCRRMLAPITGTPTDYNSVSGTPTLTDACRAGGDGVGWNFLGGATGQQAFIQFNTIITYGGVAIDAQIQGAGSCTSCTFTFQDNLIMGYSNPNFNSGILPGMWNVITPTTQDHNTYFNLSSCPAVGGTENCGNILFVGQPSSPTTDAGLDSFNVQLTSGSPGVHTGVVLAGLTTDFFGVTRPNPPSRGAAEFTSSTPATTITFGGIGTIGQTISH